MTRYHSRPGSRPAFTLIELLVVIAIIAVLVSLTAAGVMNVMTKIPETQTRTEIGEMDTALGAMMSDFNLKDPPPSILALYPTYQQYITTGNQQSLTFLQKMFGRNLFGGPPNYAISVNWGGSGVLNGEECLVFYLGGINLGAGPQGFSYNTMNPTPIAGQRTHGPYFTFKTNRLVPGAGGFLVYVDAWQSKTSLFAGTLGGTPYAYFSSQGIMNSYQTTTDVYNAIPYYISGTANPVQFTNPNTFQIISAGKDGNFGTTGWSPSSGAVGTGKDDQANFSAKILGAGQS